MSATTGDPAHSFDEPMLEAVVRKALQEPEARMTSWISVPVHGGAGGADILRVTGSALIGDEARPWSVIYKIVRAADHDVDPVSLRYWAREPLAYASGALDDLPGGVSSPDCYGVSEVPGQEYGLWLEDVHDTSDQWSLARFADVAYRLGGFNAAYLDSTSRPNGTWLYRDFLRSWVDDTDVARNVAVVRDHRDVPRVRRWNPGSMLHDVLELWEDWESLAAPLKEMPRTLCHMDAFRRNVIVDRRTDGSERYVLVDWAFVGLGALGEDLAALVTASVAFFAAEASQFEALDRLAFEAYVAGLADAGWKGDERSVRYAFAVASAVRYALPVVIDMLDESSDARVEDVQGRTIHEFVDNVVELKRSLFRLVGEARELRSVVA